MQVLEVANAAFDELLAMNRSSNFLQRIGIIQLQKWLNKSTPEPADKSTPASKETVSLGPKLVGPPWEVICVPLVPRQVLDRNDSRAALSITMENLPIKGKRQMQIMLTRRQTRDREAHPDYWRSKRRVNWVAAARGGIRAAAAKTAVRVAVAQVVDDEMMQRCNSRASMTQRSSLGQLPELQRWEVPKALEEPWQAIPRVLPPEFSIMRSPRQAAPPRVATPWWSAPPSPRGGALEPLQTRPSTSVDAALSPRPSRRLESRASTVSRPTTSPRDPLAPRPKRPSRMTEIQVNGMQVELIPSGWLR